MVPVSLGHLLFSSLHRPTSALHWKSASDWGSALSTPVLWFSVCFHVMEPFFFSFLMKSYTWSSSIEKRESCSISVPTFIFFFHSASIHQVLPWARCLAGQIGDPTCLVSPSLFHWLGEPNNLQITDLVKTLFCPGVRYQRPRDPAPGAPEALWGPHFVHL